MWSSLDAQRQRRRDSEIAFKEVIYNTHIRREQKFHNELMTSGCGYETLGWQLGRTTLISWMVDECESQHLHTSTLFLAINYFERLLSRKRLTFTIAQHFAAVSIVLAAKMNEIHGNAMSLPEFEDISVTGQDELFELEVLQWKLVAPTSYTFLLMYTHRFWIPLRATEHAVCHLKRIAFCE